MSPARTLYWMTTAAASIAAAFALYDFVIFNLPRMVAELQDGLPGLFRISPALALPIAIALALWLRATAALWLFVVHVLAYRLHYILGADPFEGQALTLAGVLRHPVTLAAQTAVLVILVHKGELGRP
ncbi:hypothetical protein [uncultured Tateyamaria sp.]|uniref:hypothetical protein n=1 Tax=Tateyamaria sp. 1078 TaxID=3417464 RepID=UPI002627F7E3|nr:hypothetical protein [uncultured Tateyamaria sp.]